MSLQDELRASRDPCPAPPGEPLAPRKRRWDLVLAWAIILGPALALAAFVAARQQVGDLEARLVRDANALVSRTCPRPVHAGHATPGSLGDAVDRHLAPFEADAKAGEHDDAGRKALGKVLAGDAPVSALPARYAAALARLGPDLDALLAGTRAERAELSGSWADLVPAAGTTWIGYQHAAWLAGARVRLALAAGDRERASADCLDALALGRDAAIARGLVGRMIAAAIANRLSPACAAAVDALPAARRRDAARALRAIRAATPPFSRTVADEAVFAQLMLGEVLSARARAALDPRAAAMARQGFRDTPPWQRIAVRDGWRVFSAALDEVVAAADLPERERESRLEAVGARVQRGLSPFSAIALPSWRDYARRAEASVRRLDALVLVAAAGAFRDDRGRWPGSVAELADAGELDGPEAARLSAVRVERPTGADLSLRVPLPRARDDDPGEWVVRLRGAPR